MTLIDSPPVDLLSLFSEECVLFLDSLSKKEALFQMSERAAELQLTPHRELFFESLLQRELLGSTGVGDAVAIPHAKLRGIQNHFLCVGIHLKGLSWNSYDGLDVRIICLVGGPIAAPIDYLKRLAALSRFVRNKEVRQALLEGKSEREIACLFYHRRKEDGSQII